MIGSQDLLVGLAIALFFFGAKKLPEMARSLGKSMTEFKKGLADDPQGQAVTTQAVATKEPAAAATAAGRTCPSCRATLEPGGTHCPRCGTAAPAGGTPGVASTS